MAEIRVNIFELTRQAFGLAGYTPYIDVNQKPVEIDNSEVDVFPDVESIGQSVFDTPIFESIAIKSPVDGELFYFEDAPVISVGRRKKVVRSSVTNLPGSVKEYINNDDHVIKVKGVLVNHEGYDQPFDKMEALNAILDPGVALEVESKLLQSLNIFNVVVKSYKMDASDAYSNVQKYEFECWSDSPIELDLDRIDTSKVDPENV